MRHFIFFLLLLIPFTPLAAHPVLVDQNGTTCEHHTPAVVQGYKVYL